MSWYLFEMHCVLELTPFNMTIVRGKAIKQSIDLGLELVYLQTLRQLSSPPQKSLHFSRKEILAHHPCLANSGIGALHLFYFIYILKYNM